MSEPLPEIPAATLVVFRRGPEGQPPELLMVVRSRDLAFAGGMAVFPGGRVDAEDRDLARKLAGPLDVEEAAHRIAAIRETIEETGLALGFRTPPDRAEAEAMRRALVETGTLASVLERGKHDLDLAALVPFARWCPRGVTTHRIFDTRFYLYDLGTGAVDLAVDKTENTRLFWISAAEALRRADAGELSVIFPTRRNLERLALFASFAQARTQAEAIPPRLIIPEMAEVEGRPALTIPGDLGYPVTHEFLATALRA